MVFVPVPNTARIELVYTMGSQVMENVLHYTGNNISDPEILTSLATNALASWQATWRTHQVLGLRLNLVRATSLEEQNSPGVEIVPDTNYNGTANADPIPYNCAALIQLLTAYRGRSYRGRVYLPGLGEGDQTNSNLAGSLVTALNASYSYWDFLDVSGEPYAMVVVSRFHNGQPRSIGVCTNVQDFKTSLTIASQRRRLPGRGI